MGSTSSLQEIFLQKKSTRVLTALIWNWAASRFFEVDWNTSGHNLWQIQLNAAINFGAIRIFADFQFAIEIFRAKAIIARCILWINTFSDVINSSFIFTFGQFCKFRLILKKKRKHDYFLSVLIYHVLKSTKFNFELWTR